MTKPKGQIERLEKIFDLIDIAGARGKKCDAIRSEPLSAKVWRSWKNTQIARRSMKPLRAAAQAAEDYEISR